MPIASVGTTIPFGTGVVVLAGSDSPEGLVSAIQGSIYLQVNNTNRFVIWGKTDNTPNTGWTLLSIHSGPHGNTNYVNGDGTLGGQLRVYSQIIGYGAPSGGGGDLVLVAGKHRSGGLDYDIHFSSERVGGVNGTGVVFPDIDFKVAAVLNSPARTANEWRIRQDDNSAFIGFPEAGGVGTLYGKLKGGNGANLDYVMRIGGASGVLAIENNSGSSVLNVTNAGALNAKRTVDTVQALASSTTPALDAALGNYFRCSINSNIAVVVQVPTNKPAAGESQELTIEFINASGGALGTAPTFATGADGFLFSTVTNPASGTSVFYKFRWSSPRSRWVEVGTHLAAGI